LFRRLLPYFTLLLLLLLRLRLFRGWIHLLHSIILLRQILLLLLLLLTFLTLLLTLLLYLLLLHLHLLLPRTLVLCVVVVIVVAHAPTALAPAHWQSLLIQNQSSFQCDVESCIAVSLPHLAAPRAGYEFQDRRFLESPVTLSPARVGRNVSCLVEAGEAVTRSQELSPQ
jgi:hypothetical protein